MQPCGKQSPEKSFEIGWLPERLSIEATDRLKRALFVHLPVVLVAITLVWLLWRWLAPGPLLEATFTQHDPAERTITTDRPWTMEWTVETGDQMCLSSIQVWNSRGSKLETVSSRSGSRNFSSVGEHRLVVHASRTDRVHLIVCHR